MKLFYREAEKKDFNEIFPLLEQLWPDLELNYSKLNIIYNIAIDSKIQFLIIAQTDNKIIGFCSLSIKNNLWQAGQIGHVDELIVDENYRGLGIGKNLIDEITIIAIKNKCKRIELDSAFHRKSAHEFYNKIGYDNRAYLFSRKLDNNAK